MTLINEDVLLRTLQNEERAIKIYIIEQEEKLRILQRRIRKLKGEKSVSWTEQSVELITNANEMLSTDEILRCIFVNKPNELKDFSKRKRYIASLSVALNKLEKSGKLIKVRPKRIKGFFYGLPSWRKEGGELQSYYGALVQVKTDKILNGKPR